MSRAKHAVPDIHPTAVVHPDAELEAGVQVGPYAVIGAGVTIRAGTVVGNHATVEGPATIGRNNRIFSYASVGQDPQDKKYVPGEPSFLEIGDENMIREFVTLNRGTEQGGTVTRIGNGNWIMAYVHVAHDCIVGNDTVLANCATLGGHVTIEDKAYLGGFTAVHQFCAVGEHVMTGGHTMISQDVPPFVMAAGNRAKLFGINKIGLERHEYSKEDIRALQAAYKLFFKGKGTAEENLDEIDATLSGHEAVRRFVSFIRNSTRGICR